MSALGLVMAALLTGGGTPDACVSRGELRFVCGVEDAEDLAILPGGAWVVGSRMGRWL